MTRWEAWSGWWFNVLTTLGGVDQELEEAVGKAADLRIRTMQTREEFAAVVGQDMLRKYSGELFTVLCSLTGGEANTVVRGTVAIDGGKCGFRAARKLMARFNPRTPARQLNS